MTSSPCESAVTNETQPDASNLEYLAGKYLRVRIANQQFGLPLSHVREVIRLAEITPVPSAPTFVPGVINLRGRIVTVIDPQHRMGLGATERHFRTCMVVVEAETDGRCLTAGLLVDVVLDVMTVTLNEAQSVPEIGLGVEARFVSGLAAHQGNVSLLLDVNELVLCTPITHSLSR